MTQHNAIEGVMVGSTAYGDSHLIARLATRSRGKVAVMVRGGRSSKSKFGNHFQLGAHLRVDTKRGRGALVNVSAVSMLSMPIRAREDLIRIAYLAYGCEMISALMIEDHENEKLFLLLLTWLTTLESAGPMGPPWRLAFEAKALTFSGLTPRLDTCVRCGEPLDNAMFFSDAHGGALHPHCGRGVSVSKACLEQIERLRRTPLGSISNIRLEPAGHGLLYGFFRYQTTRSLNGYSWTREVESME